VDLGVKKQNIHSWTSFPCIPGTVFVSTFNTFSAANLWQYNNSIIHFLTPLCFYGFSIALIVV
jgi:hypothetical protein